MTPELHWVAAVGEIPDGERKIVTIGSLEIGVFHANGRYFAWRNVCPHAGAPVCRGLIEGTMLPSRVYEYHLDHERKVLRCPWHGWEFALDTGWHLTDESVRLKSYDVVVDDESVWIALRRRVRQPSIEGRQS